MFKGDVYMNLSDYKKVKVSLIICIACEFRNELFQPLKQIIGKEKTLALLIAAESTARENTKTLPFSSLVE